MKPTLARNEHNRRPSEARPDRLRRPPEPWSLDLLLGVSRVRHHALSPDGRSIAYLWDRDAHSDVWLMPASGGHWPVRLTFDRPAHTFWNDSPPRWSPDGARLAYVRAGEVWTVSVKSGRSRRLSPPGALVHSPIWSPSGERVLCVYERDEVTNLCSIQVAEPGSAWPVALTHLQGDVSDPSPSPDGSSVAFVYHPRDDFNRSEICVAPSDGGEVRHLTGAPGVWDRRPRWSPDGESLAFTSNHTGWHELYLVDIASSSVRTLTEGECDVYDYSWSRDGGRIVYTANFEGDGGLHVLSLSNGSGRRLPSPAGWHGRPQWSADGAWLSVEFESPVAPPDLWKVDPRAENATPLTLSRPPALENATLVTPEHIRYPSTQGSQIPALLFKPPAASESKPCPAIVYPHGGPTSAAVLEWDLFAQWWVAKGYAVLAPNYRGSTGYGREFQYALHDRWGVADTDDMLAAADYLRGLPWIDGDRLAIYGASYGSYLAVLALARDPQRRFKCGVAKYGDSDILRSWAQGDRIGRQDLERQMQHPSLARVAYRAGSPIYDAANIQAPLLIVHGTEDRRVHPKQSEELVVALRRHDKPFEYIVYEGEGHGILNPVNQRHFYQRLERFIDWHLL